MRKIALAALLSFAAAAAGAQTLSEALTYGVNDYYGTARSIALGGAMTALGGDLGSVGINPAEFDKCREPIDTHGHLIPSLSCGNMSGVADYGRNPDPSFETGKLAATVDPS